MYYYPVRKGSEGLFEESNAPLASTAGVRRKLLGAVCLLAAGSPDKVVGDKPDPCHSL